MAAVPLSEQVRELLSPPSAPVQAAYFAQACLSLLFADMLSVQL